jgi:hypothetical protein
MDDYTYFQYINPMATKTHKTSPNHFPPMPDILQTVTGWIPPEQPPAAPATILADAALRSLDDLTDIQRRECLEWLYDATTRLMSGGTYADAPPPRQIVPSIIWVQDRHPAPRPKRGKRKRRDKPQR